MADKDINIKVNVDAGNAPQTLNELKQAQAGVVDGSKNIGGAASSAFDKFSKSIGGSLGSFLELGKAFLTNPIGIVITAVIALIKYFSQFEEVMIPVTSAMKVLSAVFDGIITNFIPILEAIGKFLTGDFAGAAAGIGEVAKGIKDQATAAWSLAQAEDDLYDAHTAQVEVLAELAAKEDDLLTKAKNKTLSDEERIKLLKESQELAKQQLEINLDLARQDAALAQQRVAAATKGKEGYDELVRAAAEANAALTNLTKEASHAQEKAQNQIDALNEAAESKRQAAAEKAKAAAEKAKEEAIKAEEDRLNAIQVANDREIALEQARGNDVFQLRKTKLEEEIQLYKEGSEKRLALQSELDIMLAQKETETRTKAAEAEEERKNRELEASNQLAVLQAESDGEKLRIKYEQDISAANLTASEKLLIDEKYKQDKAAIDEAITQKEKEEEDKRVAEKQASLERGLAIAQGVAGALGALNTLVSNAETSGRKRSDKEDKELKKKQFQRGKTLAMVNAAIATAQAIIGYNANPGFPAGIGLAVLAGITGAIQIAAIASQKFDPDSGGGSAAASITPQSTTVPDTSASAANSQQTGFQAPQFFGLGNAQTNSNQPAQQVYVTETDITQTQNRVMVIEDRAILGK